MGIREEIIFDGRQISLEWFGADKYPKGIPISQVSVYCIDDIGKVLIVENDRGWVFPGGHPEAGRKSRRNRIQRDN